MMADDAQRRYGLTEIVFWSMAGAALLVILLQSAACLYENLYEDNYFSRHYVAFETERIARAARIADGGIALDHQSQLTHYASHSDDYAYRIITSDGQVHAGSNESLLEEISPVQATTSALPALWLHDFAASSPFHVAGGMTQLVGDRTVWIEVATRDDPAHVRLGVLATDLLVDVGIPLLPLTVLSMIVATYAVGRALRPLAAAVRKAEELAAADHEVRFSLAGLPREAASFAGAINSLMERVSSLIVSQRQFLTHAAHELRTPLSVLLLELGKMKEPAARRLEADVAVMSDIVDRLLVLARMNALKAPETVQIDLDDLARQVVDRLQPLAEARGSTLRLVSRSPSRFPGDICSVYEALRNLAENALRHTPPGSTVVITCGPGGTVCVEDDGPGLPAPGDGRIFEPFRKGRAASAGAGLGLSIVKQAVELHKGTIELGRSAMGGARFEIRFARI